MGLRPREEGFQGRDGGHRGGIRPNLGVELTDLEIASMLVVRPRRTKDDTSVLGFNPQRGYRYWSEEQWGEASKSAGIGVHIIWRTGAHLRETATLQPTLCLPEARVSLGTWPTSEDKAKSCNLGRMAGSYSCAGGSLSQVQSRGLAQEQRLWHWR